MSFRDWALCFVCVRAFGVQRLLELFSTYLRV